MQINTIQIASLTSMFSACLQDPETQVTSEEVLHLRNCLVAEVLLRGAPRSGVVTNATVGEFQHR